MTRARKTAVMRHQRAEQLVCGDWRQFDSPECIVILHSAVLPGRATSLLDVATAAQPLARS